MNAAERDRLEYLRELPGMEKLAKAEAQLKAADYANKFTQACERREIRRAGERAHWLNIMLPLIKSAKRNSAAVAEPRG